MGADTAVVAAREGIALRRPRFVTLRRFLRTKPLGVAGAVFILLLIAVAFLSLVWTPHDPFEIRRDFLFTKPSTTFPLGTDHLGRDVLSRVMLGARFSLYVALIAVGSGGVIGAVMGICAGYFGGKVDTIIERIVEVMLSIPTLVLALALVAVRPASHLPGMMDSPMNDVVIAIGFLQIPRNSRVLRSVALSIKSTEYVEAAKAIGARPWRIVWKHVTPQCVPALIILMTAELAAAILIEASLGFLGLGIPPPKPSWGNMLTGPTLANVERAPWLAIFPGVVLSLTIFAYNLLGDSLRDILDPRLRR